LRILIAAATLMLAACTPAGTAPGLIVPPAPLAATAVDDQAIAFGFEAFDTLLTTVDALVAAKVLKPGSDQALKVRTYLIATKAGLNAASAAQKAGSAEQLDAALREARCSLHLAQAALNGKDGQCRN